MSARILIVYGSSYGQTAKIAERIAQLLRQQRMEVTVHKGDRLPPSLSLASYDGILLGASLISGRYQKYIGKFVVNHRAALKAVPSAFFAVSGSAAGRPEERAAARASVDQFVMRAGWNPALTACFGGAITYTRYNPFLRWMMKRINRKAGHPLDTSRDHELTDWSEVECFSETFSKLIDVPAACSV